MAHNATFLKVHFLRLKGKDSVPWICCRCLLQWMCSISNRKVTQSSVVQSTTYLMDRTILTLLRSMQAPCFNLVLSQKCRKARPRQQFWCSATAGSCIYPAALDQAPHKPLPSQLRLAAQGLFGVGERLEEMWNRAGGGCSRRCCVLGLASAIHQAQI